MLAGDGDEDGEQVESLFHLAVVDSPDKILVRVSKLLEGHWGGLYNGGEGSSHEVKCQLILQMPCQKADKHLTSRHGSGPSAAHIFAA